MTQIILNTTSIYASAKNILISRNFNFNNIEIDNTISYNYTETKSMTGQPLEVGANINDHSYLNPVDASVVISQSKFSNILNQINDIARGFPEITRDIVSKDLLSKQASFYQETQATQKLREITQTLEDLGILFDLSLPVARFRNMVLVTIDVSGDTTTQGGFNATLSFRQANIIGEQQALGLIVDGGLKQKIDFTGVI